MANTTNLNLGKLSGSEKLKTFPTMQAGNMDAIDSAFGSGFGVGNASDVNSELNSLGDGLAIIANGDTHAAITSGQYVYVRKHNTLADGLYTANSNISANATLSSINLTVNSNGGLNALNSNEAKIITQTSSRYVKHFMFQNTATITIDLKVAQDTSHFSMIEVANANQGVFSMCEGAASGIQNYGSKAISASVSGATLTIKRADNGTFWGTTHVTLTTSYNTLEE